MPDTGRIPRALFEKGGLGGIQVFGFARTENPTAKADHLTAYIDYRKHDAVAEAVVSFAFFILDYQTGFQKAAVLVIFKFCQPCGAYPMPKRNAISPLTPRCLRYSIAVGDFLSWSR